MNLSALHAIAEFNVEHGGPPRSVARLVDALAAIKGARVGVAFGGVLPTGLDRGIVNDAKRFPCPPGGFLSSGFHRGLWQAVETFKPTVLHSHGIWRAENHWMAQVASKSGVVHVVQPRGMLSGWALSHKRWRKRAAWRAYQRRDLGRAHALVATSAIECADFRDAGLRMPVAVIPNGVDPPTQAAPVRSSDELRTALFLSRLHRGKGLLELVRAWARLKPSGWRLRVAGNDVDGLWPEAAAICDQAGLRNVEYLGEVDSRHANALYREADLFVLPTRSENFGMVVAEALAHGVPVLTTRGAPWQDLIRYDCGWWIDLGEGALEQGLREATGLSPERLAQMGRNGLRLAERYSWPAAAKKTLDFYRWLLEGGSRPAFVDVLD